MTRVFFGLSARDDVRSIVVILEILACLCKRLVQLCRIDRAGIQRAGLCLLYPFFLFICGISGFGRSVGERSFYLVFDLRDLIVHVFAHAMAQVFFLFRGLLCCLRDICSLLWRCGSGLARGLAGALGALFRGLLGWLFGRFRSGVGGVGGGGLGRGGVGKRGGIRHSIQYLACFLAGEGALRALFQAHVLKLCHQFARGKPQLLGQGIDAGLVLELAAV